MFTQTCSARRLVVLRLSRLWWSWWRSAGTRTPLPDSQLSASRRPWTRFKALLRRARSRKGGASGAASSEKKGWPGRRSSEAAPLCFYPLVDAFHPPPSVWLEDVQTSISSPSSEAFTVRKRTPFGFSPNDTWTPTSDSFQSLAFLQPKHNIQISSRALLTDNHLASRARKSLLQKEKSQSNQLWGFKYSFLLFFFIKTPEYLCWIFTVATLLRIWRTGL